MYDVPKALFVWISPKMLCSPVLAALNFADSKLLDFKLPELAIARLYRTLCVVHYTQYYVN